MTTVSDIKSHKKVVVQTSAARIMLGVVLSVLSGTMLLLAFPPYGVWWLAWFAFVPGIFAQYRLFPRKRSSLAPAIYTLVWLGPYMARLFGTEFGPFFTYLGVLIAIFVFFMTTERAFIERTRYRWMVLQGVVGWVGFEMIRATFIPLVATSAFIGYTQATQAWMIQPVSIFSVYGMNIVIMMVNYTLALGIIAWFDRNGGVLQAVPTSLTRNWLVVSGVVLAAWIGTSLVLLNATPNMPSVRVAAIQPGYSKGAFQDEVNTSHMRFDAFAEDAREAAAQGAKIIFTSEMMFNFDPQMEFTEEFRALAAETDTYIFIDYSISIEGQDWRNESILLSPSGKFSAVYGKNEIPPGEPYTPTAGVYPVFDTPLGQLATMICHDANYTDTARKLAANGAQLVSSGINEFGGFGEQYWTNVSFRAIENRTAMVVTSRETGSAIINADGSLAALDLDMGKRVVLVGDVSLGTGEGTLYTSLGDILGWATLAGLVGFMVYQMVEGRKAKKAES